MCVIVFNCSCVRRVTRLWRVQQRFRRVVRQQALQHAPGADRAAIDPVQVAFQRAHRGARVQSHSFSVPSSGPDASCVPSGLIAQQLTQSEWPSRGNKALLHLLHTDVGLVAAVHASTITP